MRNDKQRAVELRRRGLSYNAIGRKLSIPKSTLSEWFSQLPWSENLKRDLTQKAFLKVYPQLRAMQRANALRWAKWREAAREEAQLEFKKFSPAPLFISGVMIYWGEGDKIPKNPVRVSNIDPQMLRIFSKFLRKYCVVPEGKIKAHMTLYPDLNESVCKKYWSDSIEIKPRFFNKTQIIVGRHKTKKLHYGICSIEVSSRQLKEKLLVWISNFSTQL